MNTTIHHGWSTRLYLDALGSASVIAASIFIFLAAAAIAISDTAPRDAQIGDACPDGRFAAIDYTDQRPGAPQTPERSVCA